MYSADCVLENVSKDRETWLKLRRETVGSSEISVVCGLNPYKGPLTLQMEKWGQIAPDDENDFMWLGTRMESVIADLYARRTGAEVTNPNALFVSRKYPFASASPDRLYRSNNRDDSGVLEIKNTSFNQRERWQSGEAPTAAHMQLMWQLGVMGLEYGTIAALVGGNPEDFYTPEFQFDAPLFEQMIEIAGRFIEATKAGIQVPASAADKAAVEKAFTRQPEKEIDLPHGASILLERYNLIKRDYDALSEKTGAMQKELDEIKTQIMQAMGDASIAHWGSQTIRLTKVERKAFTSKASSYTKFSIKERLQ